VKEALFRMDAFPACESALSRAQVLLVAQRAEVSNLSEEVQIWGAIATNSDSKYLNLKDSFDARVKKERLIWGGAGMGAGALIVAVLVAVFRK
jgi:tripartite-type tricarboxylate transporter receptor subunit TctC